MKIQENCRAIALDLTCKNSQNTHRVKGLQTVPEFPREKKVRQMKAVIHIGSHKTGTSTIQSFLETNRNSLKKQGIYVPKGRYFNWAKQVELLVAAAIPDAWHSRPILSHCGHYQCARVFKRKFSAIDQEKIWKRFWRENKVNCNQDDLVVFSCEELGILTSGEIEKLKKLMKSLFDDVTIVLYLRRQPEFLISFYNTRVRGGLLWNFSDYLDQPEEDSNLAYHEIVKRWSIFGKDKLKIRVFDKREFHGNDLLSDFANAVGFDMRGLERVANQNLSIDSGSVEFLRLLNSHIPATYDQWTLNPIRLQLRKCFDAMESDRKAYYLNRRDAQRIIDQFREGNDWVAREYLGREKLFSDDVSMYPEEVASPHNLTLEKCAEITASLWNERCQQIVREKKKRVFYHLKTFLTRIKRGVSQLFR